MVQRVVGGENQPERQGSVEPADILAGERRLVGEDETAAVETSPIEHFFGKIQTRDGTTRREKMKGEVAGSASEIENGWIVPRDRTSLKKLTKEWRGVLGV